MEADEQSDELQVTAIPFLQIAGPIPVGGVVLLTGVELAPPEDVDLGDQGYSTPGGMVQLMDELKRVAGHDRFVVIVQANADAAVDVLGAHELAQSIRDKLMRDPCTPGNPCPVANDEHLDRYGECFVASYDHDEGVVVQRAQP